jgi:hypothetical protein
MIKHTAILVIYPGEFDTAKFPDIPDSTWSATYMEDMSAQSLKEAVTGLMFGQAREHKIPTEELKR